jgi:polar amino acid transport system substrate-binding protein
MLIGLAALVAAFGWGPIVSSALAKDYSASIAKMPVYAESTEKGVLVDLVKAIATASGNNISIQVHPFARSMDNVINRKVDFHLPMILNPNVGEDKLDYDHSTETIFHVNFVLYSNKNKILDKNNLAGAKIDTDRAHTQYFPFPTEASSDLEGSLKKVDIGRIDGFIFADQASDPIIKAAGLKNIHRQLYQTFDVKIILPKGEKGKEVDQMFTEAIKKLRESGEYQKIMGVVDQKYDDWQP